jgi:nitrogen fixation/metabolism regulation signal transduction histidine kinase
MTNISLVIAIIIEVIILIVYLQKTNRDLVKFINEFQFEDSSIILKDNSKNKSFIELYNTLNDLYIKFKQIRFEKERDFYYFQNAFQHTSTGLLAFNNDGKIELFNEKAKEIFNIRKLEDIKQLDDIQLGLSEFLISIPLEKSDTLKLTTAKNIAQLTVHATVFKYKSNSIKLISVQNIQNEIEEREIDVLQKLIKILTHEISNTVSPINLVSTSLLNQIDVKSKSGDRMEISDIGDFKQGLKAIKKRSRGLSEFIERYMELVKIPEPKIQKVNLHEFISEAVDFMQQDFVKYNIEIKKNIYSDQLEVNIDKELVFQVLLNLLKNSIYALNESKNPFIKIEALENESNIEIFVIDNGKGISNEIMDHIFIPFFTTKEEGSGIGLSLSRQIMRIHGGSISIHSIPNIETKVILKF